MTALLVSNSDCTVLHLLSLMALRCFCHSSVEVTEIHRDLIQVTLHQYGVIMNLHSKHTHTHTHCAQHMVVLTAFSNALGMVSI